MNVGDKVYIVSGLGDYSYTPATIAKVTASGQVDVKFAHSDEVVRFNSDGYERTSYVSRYSRRRIDKHMPYAERAEWVRQQNRFIAAANAINGIVINRVRRTYSKEELRSELAILQQKIAEARLLVEAI